MKDNHDNTLIIFICLEIIIYRSTRSFYLELANVWTSFSSKRWSNWFIYIYQIINFIINFYGVQFFSKETEAITTNWLT